MIYVSVLFPSIWTLCSTYDIKVQWNIVRMNPGEVEYLGRVAMKNSVRFKILRSSNNERKSNETTLSLPGCRRSSKLSVRPCGISRGGRFLCKETVLEGTSEKKGKDVVRREGL